MLVTTSIIESGIDIPSANTLVVERADLLGLAQLYQIRGRIGRSDAHAYAYLLYPSEDLLTSEAAARLTTLTDHTELGAGFKIAMRDLEIRGAGNLLGDEQSRARRGGRLRDVRADARGGRRASCAASSRGAGGAGARRPAGHRLRAAGVHRLRGDQDRRAPAHRAGAHDRRARRRARRARRPLRPAAGAGREPAHACRPIRIKAAELGRHARSPYRGGRLQVDGLDLDDEWAARVRAADEPRRLLQAATAR